MPHVLSRSHSERPFFDQDGISTTGILSGPLPIAPQSLVSWKEIKDCARSPR
jgi:hypothetical protein